MSHQPTFDEWHYEQVAGKRRKLAERRDLAVRRHQAVQDIDSALIAATNEQLAWENRARCEVGMAR